MRTVDIVEAGRCEACGVMLVRSNRSAAWQTFATYFREPTRPAKRRGKRLTVTREKQKVLRRAPAA